MQLTNWSGRNLGALHGILVAFGALASMEFLSTCLMPPYYQPIQARQAVGEQIVVQPGGGAGGGSGYGSSSSYRGSNGPSFPSVPPGGASVAGGYNGEIPVTPAFYSDSLATPPFTGRIYFGWVPFQENGLVTTVCSSEGEYIEVAIDGRPATIVIDHAVSQRRVARGDHANRDVNIIPPNAHSGQTQLDAPGEHGAEMWCYTEVPGIGLVQVGHTRVPLGRLATFCGNVGHIRCAFF